MRDQAVTLFAGVALLVTFVVGLRWIEPRVFQMLKTGNGPPPIVLCGTLGSYRTLPLLLAPILGLTEWSPFWVGLYTASSLIMSIAAWIFFQIVRGHYPPE